MKKTVAIFGGGPSALALASFLDSSLFQVTIYEQNKTCGRKFLVAGKGGFNLTFDESMDVFKTRYLPTSFLDKALDHFSNKELRHWLSDLGVETFVGSSHRVFPTEGIKPIQVLDIILKHLESEGVKILYQKKWTGWSAEGIALVNGEVVEADYYVFAFGGASWKITGSTGAWAVNFRAHGIKVNEFEPSNCAFRVNWDDLFLQIAEGEPLKNIAIRCRDKIQKGEAVITRFGLEGNAIYALSNTIRKQLQARNKAEITIDFKPMFSSDEIKSKRQNSKSRNNTDFLKRDLKLSKVQILLIKLLTSKHDFMDRERLIEMIKGLPISIEGMAPIDEAISTAGGVRRDELTESFELRKIPHSYCIGEMVDWDAPTGGYLLQGCMSIGAYLASILNQKE